MQVYDCVIIGGGISGLLTAWHLHEVGMRVAVVEAGDIGQESSWAGGGILSPLYPWRYHEAVTALAQYSQRHYPNFAKELHEFSRIDPEYVRNGLLILDTDETDQAVHWAQQHEIKLEKIDRETVFFYEPELTRQTQGDALWMPEIGQLRNPRLLRSLYEALCLAGVSVLEQQPVLEIKQNAGHITGVVTTQETFATAQVVVTAGAWSGQLLQKLGVTMNVYPVRGQMILFTTQPGLVSRIVLANGHYMIPRRDGCLLIGSTVEEDGFQKYITKAAAEDLKYFALGLIPRLAEYTISKQWAGLRPGSPNGIPYIGAHPDIKGLYFNAGHFRNGVVMGWGAARLLVDLMVGRIPILNPAPYALDADRGTPHIA
jgi:glycine oxidase